MYGLQPDAFTSEHLNVLQASAHQLGDAIGEKLHAEQTQRSSRSSEWRHRNSHARHNPVEENRSSLPSVLTSAK